MDPNETLKQMRDESLPIEERQQAAKALKRWVNNGGFLPRTGYGFGGNTATKFRLIEECRTVQGLRPLDEVGELRKSCPNCGAGALDHDGEYWTCIECDERGRG